MPAMITLLLVGLSAAGPETPAGQELSVERVARQYRIHVYETYRTDRETYDRFRKAGDELLESWQSAGQPGDHRREVVDWYQQASAETLAMSLPPLPDLPEPPAAQPEATVEADLFAFPEEDSNLNLQPPMLPPAESGEVYFESADQPQQSDDSTPNSTSAVPAEEDRRSPAEKWSDAPKSVMTIGRFMLGVAGP